MKIKISPKTPLLVIVVPGFGAGGQSESNLISRARIPFLRSLTEDYPSSSCGRRDSGAVEAWADFFQGAELLLSRFKTGLVCDSATAAAARRFLFGNWPDPVWHYFPLVEPSLPALAENLDTAAKNSAKLAKAGRYELIFWLWGGLDRSVQYLAAAEITELLEHLDRSIKNLAKQVVTRGGTLVFTSPYGRAETAQLPDSENLDRSISSSPVPLVVAGRELRGMDLGWGGVGDGDFSLLPVLGESREILPIISGLLP